MQKSAKPSCAAGNHYGIIPLDRNPKVTMMDTLGDALPREMARVRDKVMPAYHEIGPGGVFALAMMRADLDRAAKALAEGDVVEMIRVYASLKGYKT